MVLKTGTQWLCDSCGEIIAQPAEGWLEWAYDESSVEKAYPRTVGGFRIVHHIGASPRAPNGTCYQYSGSSRAGDAHLDQVIRIGPIYMVMTFLDFGPVHDPQGKHPPRVTDLRNWSETFRRLFVPGYEQVRRYYWTEEGREYVADANELRPYMNDFILAAIEHFRTNPPE